MTPDLAAIRARLEGLSANAKYRHALRERKRAAGLCFECAQPATSGRYCAKHRDDHKRHVQAYKTRYPEKYYATRRKYVGRPEQLIREHAREAVQNAVRRGRLVKPSACQDCGSGGRLHGHHEDYSKQLDVIWVCHPCHVKRHRTMEANGA